MAFRFVNHEYTYITYINAYCFLSFLVAFCEFTVKMRDGHGISDVATLDGSLKVVIALD